MKKNSWRWRSSAVRPPRAWKGGAKDGIGCGGGWARRRHPFIGRGGEEERSRQRGAASGYGASMLMVFKAKMRGGKAVSHQFGGGREEDSTTLLFLDLIGRGAHNVMAAAEKPGWARRTAWAGWAGRARPEA
jgi:hypothetical protein